MKEFIQLLKKDLKLIFFHSVAVSIVFSIGLFAFFRFSSSGKGYPINMIFWASHFLSITFIILQSQEWEQEDKAYRLLLVSDIDQSLLFLSKSIAVSLGVSLLWIIEMAFLILFFDALIHEPLKNLLFSILKLTGIGFLSNFALSSSGTQASALSVHSNYPWMLLFLIFLPLSLPIVIAASKLTWVIFNQQKNQDIASLYFIIVSFNLLYTAAGIMLYDKFLEE